MVAVIFRKVSRKWFMMVYSEDHHNNGVFSCHVPLQVTVFTHITQ